MAGINFSRTALPLTQFEGDIDELFDLFVAHLVGTFTGGTLTGQVNGSAPLSDMGPWLNQTIWEVWNTSEARYLPLAVTAGKMYQGNLVTSTIQSGATVNRTLTTPDKDGTIATTDDVGAIVATNTIPGAATISLDTSLKAPLYVLLTANTTITPVNMVDGQKIDLWLENNGTTYTVAWANVIWPAGTAPTITTGTAGNRRIDHLMLEQIGTQIYGRVAAQDYRITTGSDVTPPTITGRRAYASVITLSMSELIQAGNALPTTDFEVRKNNNVQTITGVVATGQTVKVTISSTFTKTDVMKVKYIGTGTSIKDLTGNACPADAALVTATYGTTATGTDPGDFGGANTPP